MEALDNSLDALGAGAMEISHNVLRSQSVGVPWPFTFRPNGIVAGWFFDPSGAADAARNPRYRLSHNRVELQAPTAVGIYAVANGMLIDENRIAVEGVSARGIVSGVADGLIVENTITGSGLSALEIAPFYTAYPAVVADRNTAACNDVSGFTASVADLVLSGNDNSVIGFAGSVLDQGSGNRQVGGEWCEEERE